jgi:PTH1 family peptidyl-tRNA hydrolase
VRVIVGLGNPGADYEGSRHNAGFLVVAGLAEACGLVLSAGRGDFISGNGRIEGTSVRLTLPLTYMNRSGLAVAQILAEADVTASEMLVICDDVNLPLGQLRLRPSGSDGGHNGLASIIESLGTESFARLRLGVGSPPQGEDRADYVLDTFREDERETVADMVERSISAVRSVLRDGIDSAMTVCNRRTDADDRKGT